MEKDTKKTRSSEGERRKRKSTHKKDDKKNGGKQKKTDKCTTEENSLEGNDAKEKDKQSTSRPASPEPNCSICLGDLQNKSFTDSCFHMFCFVCLKEWSKVKAECPLCKQKFQNIIYNVTSYEKYDRYNISEEEANRNSLEQDGARFRYRTTLTFERRFTFEPEHNYTQPIGRPSRVATRSHWRRYRQPSTSDFRRRIYDTGIRAQEPTGTRLRVRDVTPAFYRRNPAQTHRLVPWLNRELNSLIINQPDTVQTVIEIIMGLIKSYSIDSEEFYQHICAYVGRNTRHFMHEFLCFAKSPFNMTTYDNNVAYQSAYTINSDSNSDDEDYDRIRDNIIRIEDENANIREPPVERPGNRNIFDDNLTPLLRSVRDILETETPGSSLHVPVSMSGWDSPTPGPSWMSVGADMEVPSALGGLPIVGNRESSPIKIESSSDSDADSTDSVDSKSSDIVFLKIDKPWEDRSPIMLSSENSDEESKMSAAFISKHYKKKKEHKKHKSHKKHKDIRDIYKDRLKHKKSKRHHSSSSRSRSKQRDSVGSNSTPKHADRSSSKNKDRSETFSPDGKKSKASSSKHNDPLSSSSEIVDLWSSSHKEKHKKHKKHKRHDHDKKPSSRMQSVIVLPNYMKPNVRTTENLITSRSEPTIPFSSGSIQSCTKSQDEAEDLSTKSYRPKKHYFGHKKSSKLIDIVPKLLEKKSTTSDSQSKKSESSLFGTNTVVPEDPLINGKEGQQSESSGTLNVTSPTERTTPVKSEDILSLENSRRCLKCQLLYIPELLDKFDICFTCKNKKVCETESRNKSNKICSLAIVRSSLSDDVTGSQTYKSMNDNVVIQEGRERTLRPELNRVDLTAIDAPLLEANESDNDDCELILSKSSNKRSPLNLDPESFNKISKKNIKIHGDASSSFSDSLSLDLNSSTMTIPRASQSSYRAEIGHVPWDIEMSNPSIPSSNNLTSYLTPDSALYDMPLFPRSLQSISPFGMNTGRYHDSNDEFSNSISNIRSSYCPISFTSRSEDHLLNVNSKANPFFIDVENDSDCIEKRNSSMLTNTSTTSSENLCLTDSDDSNGNLEINSDENTNIKQFESVDIPHESNDLLKKDTICNENKSSDELSLNSDQRLNDFDGKNEVELDDGVQNSDEADLNSENDTTDNFYSKQLIGTDKIIPQTSQTVKENEQESGSSTLDLSSNDDTLPRETPRSLAEKLTGLTDFSSNVLQSIGKEDRLTFHNIISDAKKKNNSDCSSKILYSQSSDENSMDKNTNSSSSENEMLDYFPTGNCGHSVDSLQPNININVSSPDELNCGNYPVNSDSTLMSCTSYLDNQTHCMSPIGSVTMESEGTGIFGTLTNHISPFRRMSFSGSDSDSEHPFSSGSADYKVESSKRSFPNCERINLYDNNDMNSIGDQPTDYDNQNKQDTNQVITFTNDDPLSEDSTETILNPLETDFTDSDLNNSLSQDTDNQTEQFRIDILSTDKELSNIFGSSDNESNSNF